MNILNFEEDYGRDYGDENDYNYNYGDEDEFYLNDDFYEDEEEDDEDLGGSLVPSNPYPRGPSFGDTIELEEQLILF